MEATPTLGLLDLTLASVISLPSPSFSSLFPSSLPHLPFFLFFLPLSFPLFFLSSYGREASPPIKIQDISNTPQMCLPLFVISQIPSPISQPLIITDLLSVPTALSFLEYHAR